MKRNLRLEWRRWLVNCIVLTLLAAGNLTGLAVADDNATSSSAASKQAIADSLKKVFAGATPVGVSELKGMQSHIQKLTDQLAKCTVGVEVRNAQGSGVIISKDGFVLTAAHVAGQPNREVRFFLSDGRTVTGKTLGSNKDVDAGLMKITEPGDYPFAEIAETPVKENQWCLAMGHPGGYQGERGVVLRLGRVLLANDQKRTITTNCTLVGGDSGGPLFDLDGHVIGINSRIGERLDVNMHVSASAFKDDWQRLEKGEIWGNLLGRKPYLGVSGTEDTSDAKISAIKPGSPADQAGLQVGDVVLKFGGKEITDFNSLIKTVQAQDPPRGRGPRRIPMEVRRGEQTLELQVRLAYREE